MERRRGSWLGRRKDEVRLAGNARDHDGSTGIIYSVRYCTSSLYVELLTARGTSIQRVAHEGLEVARRRNGAGEEPHRSIGRTARARYHRH